MLIGKRSIDTSIITTTPVDTSVSCRLEDLKTAVEIDTGLSFIDVIFDTPEGNRLMSLTYGIKNHSLCLLAINPKDPDSYLPYVVNTSSALDSYAVDHFNKLINDHVFYSTGLTIEVVGLYYYDEVLGKGVIENQTLELNSDGSVTRTFVSD